MKKLFYFIITVVTAGMFIGCGSYNDIKDLSKEMKQDEEVNNEISSQNTDRKFTFKIGHGAAIGSNIDFGFTQFKKIVEERTSGKIKVEIYPNQQLGGDRELTESTQFGNTAMAAPSSAPVATFEKAFYALDIPFLFPDKETVYKVLDGNAGQELLKTLDNVGLKGLGYWENGFRHLTNSKRIITVPEDLKGLKIRTMENDIHLAAWKLLGSDPSPMAFGDLFSVLEQKTFDGQENPLNLIYSHKLYEVQPYVTKTNHIYSPLVVFINKDLYESLPDIYKKIVEDAVRKVSQQQRKYVQQLDEKAEQEMKDCGVKITELTAKELKPFRDKVKPVYDIVKEKAGDEIVEMFINAAE